jgi:hypothetical protein
MTPCTGGTLPVYASNCEEGVQQKALFDIETVALRLSIYLSIYLVASHIMMVGYHVELPHCTALELINDGMDGCRPCCCIIVMDGWRESSHKYQVTAMLPSYR